MFQMFVQKGAGGLNLGSVQLAQGNAVQQGGTLSMQGQVVSAGPLQNSIQQQHAVQPQSQQQTLIREQSTALSQVRITKYSYFFPTFIKLTHLFLTSFCFFKNVSTLEMLSLTLSLCISVSAVVSHPAASTESTPCVPLQHNDDPSAKLHQHGPDCNKPGSESWTQHSCCGYIRTGPFSSA